MTTAALVESGGCPVLITGGSDGDKDRILMVLVGLLNGFDSDEEDERPKLSESG